MTRISYGALWLITILITGFKHQYTYLVLLSRSEPVVESGLLLSDLATSSGSGILRIETNGKSFITSRGLDSDYSATVSLKGRSNQASLRFLLTK